MPLPADEITTRLKRHFPNAEITLEDLAGDNDHYAVTVRCASFQGQSRVNQHKRVYAALEGAMTDTLHALQVKTITAE